MQELWIFANPIAGRGQSLSIAHQLQTRLQNEGFAPRLILDRADTLPPSALQGHPHAAIVIGGDGTLRTVAQRLYAPNLTDNSNLSHLSAPTDAPPLLTIPLGTANLMGRHLGIRWNRRRGLDQVAAALHRMQIKPMDAALANRQLCLLMAHVGFDAHVVHELARLRRGPIRYASYIRPAMIALAAYQPPLLRVHLDGRPVFHAHGMALVANIPEYGTGFPLLPDAIGNDGLLDLCCIPCRGRRDVIRFFLTAAAELPLHAQGTIHLRGRHIRIEATPPAPIQIDGDPAGLAPLDIRLLPFRIPFVLP